MTVNVLVEACVESAESAVQAERGGADRVELCANLVEGGTTPSEGSMLMARARVAIPICAMIRPRGGDFFYTELEREIMFRDIHTARRAGMNGVVFGVLEPGGDVDAPLLKRLVEESRPMTVTFHRAFDVCRDPEAALDVLAAAGVDRVLTSGQSRDVIEGLSNIQRYVRYVDGRISVMPGGGIDADNVARVAAETGAREVHVHVPKTFASPMTWRNENVFMGDVYHPDEYRRVETDASGVARVVNRLRSA